MNENGDTSNDSAAAPAPEAPVEKSPEEKAADAHQETLKAIRTIEKFWVALDKASFAMKDHDAVFMGMLLIKQIHESMLSQLPQDLVTKVRKTEGTIPLTMH